VLLWLLLPLLLLLLPLLLLLLSQAYLHKVAGVLLSHHGQFG
jgi:hypothetical protein